MMWLNLIDDEVSTFRDGLALLLRVAKDYGEDSPEYQRVLRALAALEAAQEWPGCDWTQAPEWAGWLAKDCTGGWFWHEYEPAILHNQGWRNKGRTQLAQMASAGWLASVQSRPSSKRQEPEMENRQEAIRRLAGEALAAASGKMIEAEQAEQSGEAHKAVSRYVAGCAEMLIALFYQQERITDLLERQTALLERQMGVDHERQRQQRR
jgi:hypothetical protein